MFRDEIEKSFSLSLKIKQENNILASIFKNENSCQSLLPPSIKKPLIASLDIFSLRFFGGSVTLCHLHCHGCKCCLCHSLWSRAGNTFHIVDQNLNLWRMCNTGVEQKLPGCALILKVGGSAPSCILIGNECLEPKVFNSHHRVCSRSPRHHYPDMF